MKSIFITTKFEGYHKYPNAPDEVDFLKLLHRHMFGVKCKIQVFHDDRELEFIMVKHRVEEFIQNNLIKSSESCESYATKILCFLEEQYCKDIYRQIIVSVDEDGENGAEVYNNL